MVGITDPGIRTQCGADVIVVRDRCGLGHGCKDLKAPKDDPGRDVMLSYHWLSWGEPHR